MRELKFQGYGAGQCNVNTYAESDNKAAELSLGGWGESLVNENWQVWAPEAAVVIPGMKSLVIILLKKKSERAVSRVLFPDYSG